MGSWVLISAGWYKPFTVKIGTIFEASHVAMNLWLQAIYLMCASKKGISSNQLHRYLAEYEFRYNNRVPLVRTIKCAHMRRFWGRLGSA